MALRLVVLLLSTLLLAPALAATEAPRICVTDSRQALERFAEFHELATRRLFKTRALSHKPRRFDDLASDAERYIEERQKTGLLIFAWDDSDLCMFLWPAAAVSPDGYLYARLPGARPKLVDATRRLGELAQAPMATAGRLPRKRGATAYDDAPAPPGDIDAVNGELSALLFPPPFHEALAKVDHLSIVPVGPIATAPLFMLKPLGDERVAVELFSINILTLMEDIQQSSPAPEGSPANILVIGNPTTHDTEWDFPDLPGAEAEARFAHSLFGGTLLTRQEATLARFEDLAPAADLIVLAAHGVSDDADPLDGSFLALADHRLSPRDIQSLAFEGHPLVVLSACQSGLGQALDAGVIGLARAFQIAGAANTIMSLWSVDDDATRFLMEHFYRLLAEHEPAEALRRATLATRQRYPHPGQWASFAVFGGAAR